MPKAKERSGKKSFSRPSLPPFFTVPQKGGETIHQTHTAAQPSAVALVSQHGTHRAIEAVFATSTVQGEVFVFYSHTCPGVRMGVIMTQTWKNSGGPKTRPHYFFRSLIAPVFGRGPLGLTRGLTPG